MNETQMQTAISVFKKVGFPNLQKHALQTLSNHFTSSNQKLIMVMSHTCMQDFLLGLLLFKETSIPTVMFTNFRNPILKQAAKYIGMITHKKGMSNTQSIVHFLQNKPAFGLLISLARTRQDQKIHSGYFYIAQALQAPIIVLGFDYFLHTGYVSAQKWLPTPNQTYTEFQSSSELEIVRELQNIYPKKPQLQVGFSPQNYHSHVVSVPPAPSEPALYMEVLSRHFKKESFVVIGVLALLLLLLLYVFAMLAARKRRNKKEGQQK